MLRKGLFALVLASFMVPSLVNSGFIKCFAESDNKNDHSERTDDLLIADYWLEAETSFYKNNLVISNAEVGSLSISYDDLFVFNSSNSTYISGDTSKRHDNVKSFYIFNENGKAHLSLQYFNNNGLANIYSSIETSDYLFLLNKAEANDFDSIKLANIDEAKQSYTSLFKQSFSYQTRGLYESATQIYCDTYTNYNGIIHEYVDDYLDEDFIGTGRCENRIVDIVPKYLFSQLGDYICIGKEYGFYINTGADYLFPGDYVSDVMVFDVEYFHPYTGKFQAESGYLRLKPLFQYRYATRLQSTHNDFSLMYHTNSDRIVVQHLHVDSSNYYIANPQLATTLANGNDLNYGDIGYSLSNDNGTFFITNVVEGKFLQYNPAPNFNPDVLSVFSNGSEAFASLVGYINTYAGIVFDIIASVIDKAVLHTQDHFNSLNTPSSFRQIYTYENDVSEQIYNYSKFVRSLNARAFASYAGFLSTRQDCYFESIFRIANCVSGGKPVRIYCGISLDIYGPSTVPSNPNASPQTMGSADYYDIFDECAFYPPYLPISAATISQPGGFVFYRFRPDFTESFTIKTTGTCDTQLYIYDENGDLINYDDDSGSSFNASITRVFTKNKLYYIKAKLYSENSTGTFEIINEVVSIPIYLNVPQTFYMSDVMYRINSFVPSTTRSYTITLERSGDEADPELFVYNSSMMEIGYNDDYIDENSRIDIVLNAGSTYYIKSKMTISFYSGNLTLKVF